MRAAKVLPERLPLSEGTETQLNNSFEATETSHSLEVVILLVNFVAPWASVENALSADGLESEMAEAFCVLGKTCSGIIQWYVQTLTCQNVLISGIGTRPEDNLVPLAPTIRRPASPNLVRMTDLQLKVVDDVEQRDLVCTIRVEDMGLNPSLEV